MHRSPYRPLWLGIAVASVLNVGGALFYSQVIAWFYFIGLAPGMCLGVARAIGALHRLRLQASLAMVALASSHIAFVHQFDRPAITSGFIELRAAKLAFRGPDASGVQLYFPTLRGLRSVGSALAEVVPDGATAMMVVHGVRAEVWRETGAELLPMAAAPRARWGSEFIVMGPGATTLARGARLLDGRVCMFARPPVSWRVQHDMQTGWELPEFSDAGWTPVDLPRRVAKPSLGGHNHAVSIWRAPLVGVRGEFLAAESSRRRAFVVTIHSPVNSAHWIGKAFVNGVLMTPSKGRLIYTPFSRNEEWLLDVTEHTRPGRNVLALAIDGQMPLFDLDVFELPCLDTEWYH